jgi:predicted glycoside hydrolase/deacetylase ChbG (UPF0249 family)
MAGMPGFEHAVKLSRDCPGLKIGVHLTLTTGKSVGGVYKTLTDGDGSFQPLTEVKRLAETGGIDLIEVESEYEAQIQKVLAAGINPDHFDSHHHIHNLPGVFTVFLKLAAKYGVGARINDKNLLPREYAGIRTTEAFSEEFYDETATREDLHRILLKGGGASLEVMCHPAYVDHYLLSASSYNTRRADELHILTDPETADFMARQGFEPCSFSDI